MDLWKDNWDETRRRFEDWWAGVGVIVGSWNGVRLSRPHQDVPDPGPAPSVEARWTDLPWRAARARWDMAHTAWPLETLPVADPWLGPGSLALYLGSGADLLPETVWYEPVPDPAALDEPITLDPDNFWWRLQLDMIDEMIAVAEGNYYVGCPDLVENYDTLASLRGTEQLMMDMIERPDWVAAKLKEILTAWRAAQDEIDHRVRAQDCEGSSNPGSMFGWFRVWAGGTVAKVQCDACAMFSPEMFRRFVVPTLQVQCDGLDYSIYHLDGSQCLDKLDALLEIDSLTAIEWTPDPKAPSGGSPEWYEMYRRILASGKRLQVLGAGPGEIEPLLDAVGADGIYFLSFFSTEAQAERYQRVMERVRP